MIVSPERRHTYHVQRLNVHRLKTFCLLLVGILRTTTKEALVLVVDDSMLDLNMPVSNVVCNLSSVVPPHVFFVVVRDRDELCAVIFVFPLSRLLSLMTKNLLLQQRNVKRGHSFDRVQPLSVNVFNHSFYDLAVESTITIQYVYEYHLSLKERSQQASKVRPNIPN